jgi:hypothetical protein
VKIKIPKDRKFWIIIIVVAILFSYSLGKEIVESIREKNRLKLSEQIIAEGRVSIEMPGMPTGQRSAQKIGDLEIPMITYSIKEGDSLFVINIVDFKGQGISITDQQKFYHDYAKGIEQASFARIVEEGVFTFEKAKGLRIRLVSDGNITAEAELLFVDNVFYYVMVAYTELEKIVIEEFFDSFRVLPKSIGK